MKAPPSALKPVCTGRTGSQNMMENSPFCNTFFSSYPAENAVNISGYRPQKYPLMLKPPHITPPGVSSLFPSLSQARMGNLRKLCRSHMEQEPRAEPKTPCHSHTSTFLSFLEQASKRSPAACSALCAGTQEPLCPAAEARGRNSSSSPRYISHTRTPTRHHPSLPPNTHGPALPSSSHRSHREGTARGHLCQVTSVCLPLSSSCQLH